MTKGPKAPNNGSSDAHTQKMTQSDLELRLLLKMTMRCYRIHISNRLEVRNAMASVFFRYDLFMRSNLVKKQYSLYAPIFPLNDNDAA